MALFVSDWVKNNKDKFSHNVAHKDPKFSDRQVWHTLKEQADLSPQVFLVFHLHHLEQKNR